MSQTCFPFQKNETEATKQDSVQIQFECELIVCNANKQEYAVQLVYRLCDVL